MAKKRYMVFMKQEIYYTTTVEAEDEEQAEEIAEKLWDEDIPNIPEETKHFSIDNEGGCGGIESELTTEV